MACEAAWDDVNFTAEALAWRSAFFQPKADWTSPLPTKPTPLVGLTLTLALAAVAIAMTPTAPRAATAPILVMRCTGGLLFSRRTDVRCAAAALRNRPGGDAMGSL